MKRSSSLPPPNDTGVSVQIKVEERKHEIMPRELLLADHDERVHARGGFLHDPDTAEPGTVEEPADGVPFWSCIFDVASELVFL